MILGVHWGAWTITPRRWGGGGQTTVVEPESHEDVISPLSPCPCFAFLCLFIFLSGVCSRKLRGYASWFFVCFFFFELFWNCQRASGLLQRASQFWFPHLFRELGFLSVGSTKVLPLSLHGRSGLEMFIWMNQFFSLLLGSKLGSQSLVNN